MITISPRAASHTPANDATSRTINSQSGNLQENKREVESEEQDSMELSNAEYAADSTQQDTDKSIGFARFLARTPQENPHGVITATPMQTTELAAAKEAVSVFSLSNPSEQAKSDSKVNQFERQASSSLELLQAVKHQTQSNTTTQLERQAGRIDGSITDPAKVNITKDNAIKVNTGQFSLAETVGPEAKVMGMLQKPSVVSDLVGKLMARTPSDQKPVDVASLRIDQQVADINSPERLMQQATPGRHEWSVVKMDSQQNAWSKQLFNVLQDRIEMQVHQNIKQANIRLDPPDLGRLDLSVRMDGDRLTVMVNTSNGAIRDALQASLQQLKNELSNQFGAGVDVNVGGGSGSEEKEFKESENNVALSSFEEKEENNALLPIDQHGLLNTLV